MKLVRETNKMKKLLLFFVAVVLMSCSMEEDEPIPFHLELMAIEAVEIPEYVMPGNEYQIKVYYRKPTDCHYFEGLLYDVEGPVCTVAPQSMVIEANNCEPLVELAAEEASFTFTCGTNYAFNHYLFKFYVGEDEEGNQIFEDVEIPVVQ